jgi:hypothetical protein
MTLLRLFITLSFALLLAFPALAQEPTTEAPLNDPADNLCFPGGLWGDGRCEIPAYEGATALAWECGWYFARVFDGRLSAGDVPSWCAHLVSTRVSELCKVIAANNVLCFHADQTGMLFTNGQPFIVYRFLPTLPPNNAACPVVAGYTVFAREATTVQLTRFSSDELFGQLGLLPFYCAYLDI